MTIAIIKEENSRGQHIVIVVVVVVIRDGIGQTGTAPVSQGVRPNGRALDR